MSFWKTITQPFNWAAGEVKQATNFIGGELKQATNWIDNAVKDIIPGGWTTLAEVGIALTPAGALGAAAFGGASGATGGFKKKGFDLSGAIVGGLQGYGVGSLTTSLAAAGAPPAGAPSGQATMAYSDTPVWSPETGYTYEPIANPGTIPPNPNLTPAGEGFMGPGANSTIPTENLSTISGPQVGGPPPPSGLETLGNTMSTNASNAGQAIQNLSGLGAQGASGIIPTAQAINAGMSYTAYAGLGAVALQEMARRNEENHNNGNTTNEEYERNKRELDQAIADANTNVQKYTYEPEPELTQEQATLYQKRPKTLYDQYNYAQSNQPQTLYASGGSVENYTPSEDMTAGGLASGFKFDSNNQMPMYAMGGEIMEYGIGGYARGGEPRFLSGGGDGMSDSIKAKIDGHQEARLADGEFVIPADVVSHLGNGSSKAGAKQLHAMMDRIRKARTGNPKQGKQINPIKLMPA